MPAKPWGGFLMGGDGANQPLVGEVGEYRASFVLEVDAINIGDAVNTDITTLDLDPGDWDVSGSVYFKGTSSAGSTELRAWINTEATTQPDGSNGGLAIQSTNSNGLTNEIAIGTTRAFGPGQITVYLGCWANFQNGTLKAAGFVRARRVR